MRHSFLEIVLILAFDNFSFSHLLHRLAWTVYHGSLATGSPADRNPLLRPTNPSDGPKFAARSFAPLVLRIETETERDGLAGCRQSREVDRWDGEEEAGWRR